SPATGKTPFSPATPQRRLNKNLLETYFMSGYDNLISKQCPLKEKNETKNASNSNQKTVKVELEIPGVKINITKEIIIIDALKETNMIEWFRELEQISEQNKWTEQQLLEILPYIIIDKKIDTVSHLSSYEDFKKHALLVAYPKESSLTVLRILDKTKQAEFYTVEEYHDFIKRKLEIYMLNIKCPKTEIERRTEEYFFNGLGSYTADYLIKNKYKNFKEKLEDLMRIENELKTKNRTETE
ncbi:hypothetical protein NGRA_3078, partial [Nosema granulosis]